MRRARGLKAFLDELVVAGEIGSPAVSARTVRSLQPLELQRDHSVLEIGVGDGVTTAVLAETVGHGGLVTTVDSDVDRVVLARRRLVRHYGHVSVLHREAAAGAPKYAPFDRVLAHAGIPLRRLPYAWVEQAEPGALILAPVRDFLVRFTVHADGTATGRPVLVHADLTEVNWRIRWDERAPRRTGRGRQSVGVGRPRGWGLPGATGRSTSPLGRERSRLPVVVGPRHAEPAGLGMAGGTRPPVRAPAA
ncbi:protein-L-isoaspartate O-methyltransferase [Amycolatopsis sp. 195334CR]|uniref:protein-L-isoaspartate O-methyltransferase family protein n=1 Tax=Amycolatopsis sp. 195334CR TaxID=2814588 RepID=UPI001A8C12F9|nr:hypothetical protein [Amycolatopsis sp. 195334CR]MBN6035817.1 hypothetical protein [Amycolatopsis sp. 195334CR]